MTWRPGAPSGQMVAGKGIADNQSDLLSLVEPFLCRIEHTVFELEVNQRCR